MAEHYTIDNISRAPAQLHLQTSFSLLRRENAR